MTFLVDLTLFSNLLTDYSHPWY